MKRTLLALLGAIAAWSTSSAQRPVKVMVLFDMEGVSGATRFDRIDWGCPSSGTIGHNTVAAFRLHFLYAIHSAVSIVSSIMSSLTECRQGGDPG